MDIAASAVRLATGKGDAIVEVCAIVQAEVESDWAIDWLEFAEEDGALRASAGGRVTRVAVSDVLEWIADGDSVFLRTIDRLAPELGMGQASQRADLESAIGAVRRGQPRVTLVPHELVSDDVQSELEARLTASRNVGIIGPSASGKSVLLERVSATRYATDETIWVDLADPAVSVQGVVAEAARRLSRGPRVVLFIDDAQSSPIVGEAVLRALGTFCSDRACWVVAGWPSVSDMFERLLGPNGLLYMDANSLCRRIVAAANPEGEASAEMVSLANGNALVAEMATAAYQESGTAPSVSMLASRVWSLLGAGALNEGELRALRYIACLGVFEIDADLELLGDAYRDSVGALLRGGLCRRNGSFVLFGHRTLARLLVHHLDSNGLVADKTSPVRVAVRYLRDAGPDQIKVTLERLDLVAIAGAEDQFGAAFLAQCWTALNVLTRHLADQVHEDPTWGDNVASAVFAGEAFAEVGMVDEWLACADYVRTRWQALPEHDLPTHTDGSTAESDDFATIQERMILEDREDPVDEWLPGADVDADLMHRAWVLGLLLGFEGKALEADEERTAELLRMAKASVEPAGSYYPARVPWVTARVLIGLAACGWTVQVSQVASRVSGWLRTRPPEGPARMGGVWRSGTGTWNTDLQITALVLLALGRAGVDPADPIVRSGLQTLRGGRSEWYRPGKEIDAAQALEAALVLGGNWRDYESEIRSLLQWCQDSRSWRETRALASETQDESSKVPAVASALIAVIWETVRAELPLLLQGLVGEADTGADANLEAQLIRVERTLGEIRRHVDEQVSLRRRMMARGNAATEIRQAFDVWTRRAVEIESLREALGDLRAHPDAVGLGAVTNRVEELARESLGDAYRPDLEAE